MTRKDYVLLSTALRSVRPQPVNISYGTLVLQRRQHAEDCVAIAKALGAVSKGFDKDRFVQDCGVTALDLTDG